MVKRVSNSPEFAPDVLAALIAGKLVALQVDGQWQLTAPAAVRHPIAGALSRRLSGRIAQWATAAFVLTAVALASSALYGQSAAQASSVIPYQGYLEENNAPAEGQRFLTACLFRTADATDCIWTEGHLVDVSAGRFSMTLGAEVALDSVLHDAAALYLGLTVDAVGKAGPAGHPVQLAGRQLIGSAPFARRGSPGKDFTVDGILSVGSASPEQAVHTGLQQLASNASGLWYGGAGGDLQIKTAATGTAGDRVTIKSDGRVGIGTTDPSAALDVVGGENVGGTLTAGAINVTGDLKVTGTIRGASWGFGGMYQGDDCSGCISSNPQTGDCSCPPGFAGQYAARIWEPETKCGSNLYVCVR